ncbi:HAMP domain-containing histidine kinase [Planosporangium thailandense]|uniref:histidine kinase n=1 Tax=Planosporangium thailandense TaxID=765197 RepID=A0ABX0XXY4_9ACTN|nr:HAMP domain-containing sensor histidine kinase [Planosporangium thailandense]NJC70024.1 HAMP domain-containing histidine kinase [Planosporangium thailandense]
MPSDPPSEYGRPVRRPGSRARRWWAARSLHFRLIAQLLCLLAATCVILTAAAGALMRHTLITQFDQQLVVTSQHVMDFAGHNGPSGSPPTSNSVVNAPCVPELTVLSRVTDSHVVDGGLRSGTDNGHRDLAPPQTAVLETLPLGYPVTRRLPGLGDYRLIATAAPNGDVIITGLPLAPLAAAQFRLVVVHAVVGVVSLVITVLLGTLLIRKTLYPLRRVAATAQRVAELPLDRYHPPLPMWDPEAAVDPRTEVGQVGTALNRMLDHVADALATQQASQTRLSQFSADASHELRTPLAAIRGYAELIRRRSDLPPDVAESVRRIGEDAERMTTLVEDLFRLAQLDANRPQHREPVDLSWLVADTVNEARITGPDHHWRLDLPDDPVTVLGDEANLRRAVANLLTNGRTHTPPGTTVTTSLAVSGSQATLSVVDDGPGIPAHLLPHVFDRFTRADRSRHHTGGSGGLGLAIVKAIIEAHGGDISVSSRVGRTAFTLRLPAQPDVHPAAPEESR